MNSSNGHHPVIGESTSRTTRRQRQSPEPQAHVSAEVAMRKHHTPDYTLLTILQGIPSRMAPQRPPSDRLTRAEHTVFADLVFLWVIGLTKPGRKSLYCLVSHRNQAKRLKLSEQTIRRSFRKLERLQLIKTTRRWHKKTHMENSLLITPGTLIYKDFFSFPQARMKKHKNAQFPQNNQPL